MSRPMAILRFVTSTLEISPASFPGTIPAPAQNGDRLKPSAAFQIEQWLRSSPERAARLDALLTTGSIRRRATGVLHYSNRATASLRDVGRPKRVAYWPCLGCGTERPSFAAVCKACERLARPAELELTCDECGVKFKRATAEHAKGVREGRSGTFCGRRCATRRNVTTVPCPACGTPRKASVAARAPMCRGCKPNTVDLTCEQCGGTVTRLVYEDAKRVRRGGRVFCSRVCHGEAQKTDGQPCQQCGKPVGAGRGVKFCGPECQAADLAEQRAKRMRFCPRCGVEFLPKSARTTYCTRACADLAHAARMVGLGNSRYRDGRSYAEWFKRMRPLIFVRDGNVCRACKTPDIPIHYLRKGKPTQRSGLVVHHIDERPWNNIPENLILLCKTCHAVHHKSAQTPFPWFGSYAANSTMSMTSKWKETATSLQETYSYTTA